jgi:lysophospholipase L1-like esterase
MLLAALCTLALLLAGQAPALAQSIAIAPIGDSITHGGNGRPSYRRALWQKLQQAGYDVDFVGSQNTFNGSAPPSSERDFDLDHEGHWAKEAGYIASRIGGWLGSYTPDIAIIHLGTNDFDRGQSNASTLAELGNIFSSLRADNPQVVILVAEIIPMKNRDTASFNSALRTWAPGQSTSASPVVVVDQYSGYNAANDNYDNYHPNANGEEKMAARWFVALQQVMSRQAPQSGGACVDTDPVGDGWGWDGVSSCRVSSAEPQAATCVDTDPVGDGWGWDGVSSCRISATQPQAASCVDTDPVGDGWGWDGASSCRISTSEPQTTVCVDTDPVGDGWGWDGSSSCRVSGEVVNQACIDADGDGWGWDGANSCRVE